METLLLIFLLLTLLGLWQLYHLHILYTRALRPILQHLTSFLYPPNYDDNEFNPTSHPHRCASHTSLIPTPLSGLGRPGYFTPHAHRACDLENLQVGSYAAGDERWWTADQQRAKREFVDAWTSSITSSTSPLDQDQLRYLFARLDVIFFSGALTQQQQQGPLLLPVRLDVVDWDPYSLFRIRWGSGRPSTLR